MRLRSALRSGFERESNARKTPLSESDLFDEMLAIIERSKIGGKRLARMTGLSPSTLSAWKTGRIKAAKISSLEQVAAALGMAIMLHNGRMRLAPAAPAPPLALDDPARRKAIASAVLASLPARPRVGETSRYRRAFVRRS
jgi:transcriptional regulator with XRE-family HTH domain